MSQLQFDPRDEFIIVEEKTRKPIETQPSEGQAQRAIQNLNEHEERNHRDTRYTYIRKLT